jgi:hypothetical protein
MGAKTMLALLALLAFLALMAFPSGDCAFKAFGTPSMSANTPNESHCRKSARQRIKFFIFIIMDFGSYTTELNKGPRIVSDL